MHAYIYIYRERERERERERIIYICEHTHTHHSIVSSLSVTGTRNLTPLIDTTTRMLAVLRKVSPALGFKVRLAAADPGGDAAGGDAGADHFSLSSPPRHQRAW
jgi:hypothetical protein